MDSRIIEAKLKHIHQSIIANSWPITTWEARQGTHLAPEKYEFDGEWQTIRGESLWPAGKTLFLRTLARTPEAVPTQDLYLKVEYEGLEGLLSVNGAVYSGIDSNHTMIGMPFDGDVDLAFEFMVLGASLYRPELRQEMARLKVIAFVQVDRTVRDVYYDLWFAWEASRSVRDDRRARLLHSALEEAVLTVDLTAPLPIYRSQLVQAQQLLNDRVSQIAPDPEAGRLMLTGHSHIDTAWLWPLRETIRKTARTFSTVCRLMDRYPDYRFSCSQPQLYAYTKQYYPDLYKEICAWVRAGRWECTGGMWVEPDCNIPSGEAIIRQILYGTAFFQEEFGVTPRTCWLPDVFGYPASLPGILAGCGISYFFTTKLHWQARNPFPYSLFWWEGFDGQRVLAHIPDLPDNYNGWPNPKQIMSAWDKYREKAEYPELLFPFGYGDGGGGPTEEMLEFASRSNRYPGLPAARQGLEEEYYKQVVAVSPDLPLWSGELYLETHRGTYTTHGEIKKANRLSELLLRDAEIFASLSDLSGEAIDTSPLKQAWLNLVLLQFHDILPGSSIGEVYKEAAGDHSVIQNTARQIRSKSVGKMTLPGSPMTNLVVFNSLSWARNDVATAEVAGLECQVGDALEIRQTEGRPLPAQVISKSEAGARVIFQLKDLPSLGYKSYSLHPAAGQAKHSLQVSERRIQNRFFLLELNEDGTISRLFDRRTGREVIPLGNKANQLQLLQDGPEREAAWNIHNTLDRRSYNWDGQASITPGQIGPVCASLRIEKHYRKSTLTQEMIIYDQLPRIDFVTKVQWEERQVLLKASFPLEVRNLDAAFEIQYGIVKRPTHRNTSWEQEKFEVCGHHWADLSETGYGVSLLNDCKYGYDVYRNTLRLTLLRGTEFPDPEADRGMHEFTYSLFPHLGDIASADTVRRAWELNVPALCVSGAAPAKGFSAEHSFFTISGPAVLDTIKPAEDGNGWILRLYEPYGSRGQVSLHGPSEITQVISCDHLERNVEGVSTDGTSFGFAILPFEVKTFRIIAG